MVKSLNEGAEQIRRLLNKTFKTPSGAQILELRWALISFNFRNPINVGGFLLVSEILQ